jgi:hypothetical protein
MLSKRKFVMSSAKQSRQKEHVKREYEQLTERLVANERLLIFTRMRLGLAHDHHELARMRRRIAPILTGEFEVETDEKELKKKCKVVKAAIEYEKQRMRRECK